MGVTSYGGQWPFNNVGPGYGTSIVTPSVYDENMTVYEKLSKLRSTIDEIYTFYLGFTDQADGLVATVNQKLADTVAELTLLIENNNDELKALILDSHDSAISYNPTTGTSTDTVSKVMSNVYDNTRVFAYFAKQYDDMEMTAAEYDALGLSSRKYDLAPDYDITEHDIYETTDGA